jgi:hypothetical protein
VRAGAGNPAYAKVAAAVVLTFSETPHPAFCRFSLGKLQERGSYAASGLHRGQNRVRKDRMNAWHPRVFEMFLQPTCPFSVRAFGKLEDLLDKAGEDR